MSVTATDSHSMLSGLFAAIDSKDSAVFASFLADDCVFRFGNLPGVQGVDAIRSAVDGFFASIQSLSHRLDHSWEVPGGLVCHGYVSYTRWDDSRLDVPFCNVLRTDRRGISEYLIFVDISGLYT